MEYLTVSEAAKKWEVSVRKVQRLLAGGRIPGARKYGRIWMIPYDAKVPAESRERERTSLVEGFDDVKTTERLERELIQVVEATMILMPSDEPDRILEMAESDLMRLPFAAEIRYLRGDFAKALHCYELAKEDFTYRLRVAPVAVVAAISLGDFHQYKEIETYLKDCLIIYPDSLMSMIADLALASVAVSLIAPQMIPEWMREGNFEPFPPEMNPQYILYIRSKYFLCTGQYETALGIAQTTLAFYYKQPGISLTGIYLHLVCAQASYFMGREGDAEKWVRTAMRIALPHGFITPFVETLSNLGGIFEKCLDIEFCKYRPAIEEQWHRTIKNWIVFHNLYTKENITLILSIRESQIAEMVANRVPYVRIAERFNLSVGRVKNIMMEVYQKLQISGRDQLGEYVLPIKKRTE